MSKLRHNLYTSKVWCEKITGVVRKLSSIKCYHFPFANNRHRPICLVVEKLNQCHKWWNVKKDIYVYNYATIS